MALTETELQFAVDVFKSEAAALQANWAINQRDMDLQLQAAMRLPPWQGLRMWVRVVGISSVVLVTYLWRRDRLLRNANRLTTLIRDAAR